MKFKSLILLLITPFLMGAIPGGGGGLFDGEMKIETPLMGPFDRYQSDVSSTLTVISTYKLRQTIYERLTFEDLATSASRVYSLASHVINGNSSETVSFNIPTSLYMGSSGMSITIEILRSSDNYVFIASTMFINLPGHETINPINYSSSSFVSKVIGVGYPSTVAREVLTFSGFTDYFLTDIYYRIPLEQFDIGIQSDFASEPIGEANMIIENGKDLFPNLSGVGNHVLLLLDLVKIGEIYRLSLKKPLYVNPVSVQMSSTALSGYVATNNIYYPINQLDEALGLKITFNIMNFGNNKTNLKWSTYCYSASPFIGPCNNSEYCVVGGVSR